MAIDKALKPHDKISRNKKPVLVCILDGWGENVAKDKYNAIHSAETPVTGHHLLSPCTSRCGHYIPDCNAHSPECLQETLLNSRVLTVSDGLPVQTL